jgi:hypothetical protein
VVSKVKYKYFKVSNNKKNKITEITQKIKTQPTKYKKAKTKNKQTRKSE